MNIHFFSVNTRVQSGFKFFSDLKHLKRPIVSTKSSQCCNTKNVKLLAPICVQLRAPNGITLRAFNGVTFVAHSYMYVTFNVPNM